MVDADHFITWNENTGETKLLVYGASGTPQRIVASIQGLRQVRCNRLSPLTVSPIGKYFVGEKGGLTVYRSETFEAVRHVPENAAAARFFASRPDELSNENSTCFLMDVGATLLRVVTIFKQVGDGFDYGTIEI